MAITDDPSAELLEAKRRQASSEEKFDGALERWREERRRLHSEIDSLYQAQEEARKTSLQSGAVDDGTAARLQSELDKASAERLKAEEELAERKEEWAAERKTLKESVATLETNLVELPIDVNLGLCAIESRKTSRVS